MCIYREKNTWLLQFSRISYTDPALDGVGVWELGVGGWWGEGNMCGWDEYEFPILTEITGKNITLHRLQIKRWIILINVIGNQKQKKFKEQRDRTGSPVQRTAVWCRVTGQFTCSQLWLTPVGGLEKQQSMFSYMTCRCKDFWEDSSESLLLCLFCSNPMLSDGEKKRETAVLMQRGLTGFIYSEIWYWKFAKLWQTDTPTGPEQKEKKPTKKPEKL